MHFNKRNVSFIHSKQIIEKRILILNLLLDDRGMHEKITKELLKCFIFGGTNVILLYRRLALMLNNNLHYILKSIHIFFFI